MFKTGRLQVLCSLWEDRRLQTSMFTLSNGNTNKKAMNGPFKRPSQGFHWGEGFSPNAYSCTCWRGKRTTHCHTVSGLQVWNNFNQCHPHPWTVFRGRCGKTFAYKLVVLILLPWQWMRKRHQRGMMWKGAEVPPQTPVLFVKAKTMKKNISYFLALHSWKTERAIWILRYQRQLSSPLYSHHYFMLSFCPCQLFPSRHIKYLSTPSSHLD